jgi:hemerythrin-like metal-binding protein
VIDFDIAAAWHRMFALRLELVVDGLEPGGGDPDEIGDDTRCDLGRWLEGKPEGGAGLADFHPLVDCHRDFHLTASHMMRLFNGGDIAAAHAVRETAFRAASAAVLDAIARINQAYREAPAGVGCQDPPAPEPLWDDALLIGLPAIDEQHKALAGLVSRLGSRPADDIHSEAVTEILSSVGHLIALHFDTEEIFIRRCGMPAAEVHAHVQAHDGMLQQINGINLTALAGHNIRASEIFETLRTWVIDHVVIHDFELRPYVRARND